ncbi:SH3 domain-containing protein [Roseomonas sp. WA12]
MRKGFLLAGLLALGGCFEDAPKGQAANNSAGRTEETASRVRAAAEERLRTVARDGSALRFRAVETHRQAMANTYAVCGQATLTNDTVFLPFVSVVNASTMEVEQHLARTNIEATRVYVELVGRCFDGGGPVSRAGGTPVAQQTPPLPNGLPILDQATPEPPKTPDLLSAVAASAPGTPSGTVTMRQSGNIRSSPNGGGSVLRVARSGAVLNIYGTAPGGWYQVGESAPEGWVHRSVAGPQSGTMASSTPAATTPVSGTLASAAQ